MLGLDVVDKDTAAIAMYERAGWHRVATIPCDWAPDRQMHCYLAPAAPLPPPPQPRPHLIIFSWCDAGERMQL